MAIAKAVKEFLMKEVKLSKNSMEIDENTRLIASGLLDSISQIRLVSFLERSFDIAIEAQDVEAGHLETISSIEKLVRRENGAKFHVRPSL